MPLLTPGDLSSRWEDRGLGFGFSGRATTALCGGEDGSRREELRPGGSKKGGWEHTQHDRESKMEIPVDGGQEAKTEVLAKCNTVHLSTLMYVE
jgi:hypothetical protein